eukprot:766346-Hanusia_phi.AAC.1
MMLFHSDRHILRARLRTETNRALLGFAAGPGAPASVTESGPPSLILVRVTSTRQGTYYQTLYTPTFYYEWMGGVVCLRIKGRKAYDVQLLSGLASQGEGKEEAGAEGEVVAESEVVGEREVVEEMDVQIDTES